MRTFIVGTSTSVTAYAIDNDLKREDFIAIRSLAEAKREINWRNPTLSDRVIITYGFKTMPSSQALGISDVLIANGFTRNMWRYVA